MNKAILHGEVLIHRIKELPDSASKLNLSCDYHIIAPSETTGNHHVVDVKEGVEFYTKDGVLYLKNETETSVRCLIKERHDAITLEPGIWEIDKQQEYDYLTQEKRAVAD